MGKKTNWTAAEDQALCRAWLHASEAPLPAPEQRAATFWASVHHLFHSEMSTTVERPLNGLKIRWTRINRDVQKFAVAHAQVLAAHGRGDGDAVVLDAEGEAPLIDEAKARFEKERGTKFLFEPCWKLLRYSPKWMHNLASNMGVSSASAAAAAAASSSAASASANGATADTEFLAQDRASRIDDPSVAISADAFRVATSLAGANKRRAPTFLDVLPQEPLEHLSGLTGALVEELRRRNELLEEQNALALFRLDADLAQHDDAQAYFGMLRQRYLKKMRLAVAMEGSTDVHSSVANLHHSSSTTSATASAADEEAKTTDLGDHELRVV